MNALRFLKWTAVSLACWGILLPRARMQAAGPFQSTDAGIAQVTAPIDRSAAASGGESRLAADRANGAGMATMRQVVRAQAPESQIVDVGLTAGGTLTGLVVDTAGYAVAGIEVVMYQDGQEVVRSVTNENGYFAITNLAGGVYQIVSGDGQTVFRVWAENTAPPGAESEAVVVVSAPAAVAEGPVYCEEESSICKLDVLTLALLGIAIAGLVIALDDDDDDGKKKKPASP